MATSEAAGLDLFITMTTKWRKSVPPALVDESPGTVTRVLELGLVAPGMSHSAMRQRLGLNQPEMSKIAQKWVTVGWIWVTRSDADRRVKVIRTTAAGRNLLSSLKDGLNVSLSAVRPPKVFSKKTETSRPRRRKVSKVQQEGPIPFDLDD